MRALYPLFVVSGAAALVVEVLWMRRLSIVFGATAPTASATLAATFLGMAAGSATLGPRSVRWSRPVRAFGLVELGVALGGVLVEPILALYARLAPDLYPALAGRPGAFAAVRLALAGVALFVPTFFMGASLPVLGQAVASGRARLGVTAAALYAANTLGATAGALAVPFLLLPSLGARWSYALAVSASACVGLVALGLDRLDPGARPAERPRESPGRGEPVSSSPRLAGLALLSGALVLALEVLWTRMFALVHESSVHSFAVVVALFLGGLAGGAALAGLGLRAGLAPARAMTWTWPLAGLAVIASPRVFLALSSDMAWIPGEGGAWARSATLLVTALPIVLPATVLAGTVLPLLVALGRGEPGKAIGRVVAANTLGAIVGPLAATWLLAPTTGLWTAIALVGTGMAAAPALLPAPSGARRRPSGAVGVACAAAVVLVATRPWDLPRVRLSRAGGDRVVEIREGAHGTVAVVAGRHGELRLMLDNHYVLGGTASSADEELQAHLPLLLHPGPRSAAFLGVGTGITAGAALLHPLETVVAIELVPEVVSVARTRFAAANRGLLEDPRVSVVTDDARAYLAGSGRRFDVVVGDLFVPWRPGESALYTREHFLGVRSALAEGGLYCQWLPMFQLGEEDFRTVLATFLDVFPRATVWRGDFTAAEPAIALVARRDGEPLDPASVDARASALVPRLDRATPYLADPSGIWLYLVGSIDAGDPSLRAVPLNLDREPWLEVGSRAGGSVARGGRALVGSELDAFLEPYRASRSRGALRDLPAGARALSDAGAHLWRASALLAEGRVAEGEDLALATIDRLPPPIRDALLAPAAE